MLGAYATPQLATKRLAVEKQKFEQKSIPAQKQVNPDLAALKKNALRAPKAKKAETNVTLVDEVIDLNFTTSCSKKYYADTKDWYLVAQNSDYAVVLDLFSNRHQGHVRQEHADGAQYCQELSEPNLQLLLEIF